MNARERLQQLERAVDKLRLAAVGGCVVVEGRRDVDALVALGVGGAHQTVHRGQPVEVIIDDLARAAEQESWAQIVLLLDWDRTGGRLMKRLRDGLAGRAKLDVDCRRLLSRHAHCKCVEDLPAEISSLRRQTV